MKFAPLVPPRTFEAGYDVKVRIADCGRLHLEADEQVTLTTPAGAEYDVTRKDWGFYATPSLNGRLASFGLQGVLVCNRDRRLFVLLVEKGHEDSFRRYCAGEALHIVAWLASQQDVDALCATLGVTVGGPYGEGPQHGVVEPADAGATQQDSPAIPLCPCGNTAYEPVFVYHAPPDGEVRFPSASGGYHRVVSRCPVCGHYLSRHSMDLSGLYSGEYVDATYGGAMRATFERVTSLPPARSDNDGRARAVQAFAAAHLPVSASNGRDGTPGGDDAAEPQAVGWQLLDVGSGLCVFAWRMQRDGWQCVALDPDERAVRHAREVAGVTAVHADFMRDVIEGMYDAITFNKVLEHVVDPVAMLRRAHGLLRPDGFVYIELPDGEGAEADGPGREEFFIDHHHVFSMASMVLLAQRAGFCVTQTQRLREPSGKYTLRGFLCPRGNGNVLHSENKDVEDE